MAFIDRRKERTGKLRKGGLLSILSLIIAYLLFDNTRTLIAYAENFEQITIGGGAMIVYGGLVLISLWYVLKQIKQKKNVTLIKVGMCYACYLFVATFLNSNMLNSYVKVFESITWLLMLLVGYYIGFRNNLSSGDVIAKRVLLFCLPVVSVYILLFYYFQGIIAGDAFFNVIVLFPFVLMLNSGKLKNVLVLFFILMIMLSLKRSIFLSLFASLVSYYLMEGKLKQKFVFVLCFCALMMFFLFVENVPMLERFISIVDDGGSGRNTIYLELWQIFSAGTIFQMLLGNGIRSTVDAIGFFAHNDFLQLLIDFGLIGGCFYIILIASIIHDIKKVRIGKEFYLNNYKVLCATFVLLLLLSLFNCIVYHVYYLLVVMFAIGLNMGMIMREKRRMIIEKCEL